MTRPPALVAALLLAGCAIPAATPRLAPKAATDLGLTGAAAPLRRIGRADDLAGIAVFLASRAGSYLPGPVIPVDGGLGMGH